MKTGVYPREKIFLCSFAKHLDSAVDPSHAGFDQLACLGFPHLVFSGNPKSWPLRAEVKPDEVAHLSVPGGELSHRTIHHQGNVIRDAVILDAADWLDTWR